jgi:hypothetical protein
VTVYINKAYVCGGFPDTIRNVEEKLNRVGIEVIGHCDSKKRFSVPKEATLLVLISDQLSHNVGDKARAAADMLDIPLIAGAFRKWSELEGRIVSRRLGSRNFSIPREEAIPIIPQVVEATRELETPSTVKLVPELSKVDEVIESTVEPQKGIMSPEIVNLRKAKSSQIREAVKKVFDAHKHELEVYTSTEAVKEVNKILGFKITKGTVAAIRGELGIVKPPKGFKRQYRRRRVAPPPPPPVPTATVSDGAENELDVIQVMLNEWVIKYHVSKVYLAYDNARWETNWEQLTVVQRTKKYEK